MAPQVAAMLKRDDDYDDYNDSWYWSDTGYTVRYVIVFVILTALLLFFLGGYLHARKRMKKGLQPLSYHRWMVKSRYRQPQYYQNAPPPQGYPMYAYPPAQQEVPPAYYQHAPPPPAYSPPEGASKAMADQNWNGQFGQAGEASQSVAPPSAAAAPRP
ncbi:uncharacterized protein RCC_05319 [Ramularia collo-cygni]|uniref:Uncharacterized protein n=1 Tax=Ramularia collo-cygni TaxID=112498 RepID=A0A2D3UVY4_9PEZI|nr:uncharacterized protein RCC_05319 [Ramularia collo-cygni]CZT19468.1 uncharacterized protein RCC_05319 [Ramularia collo-cygni]